MNINIEIDNKPIMNYYLIFLGYFHIFSHAMQPDFYKYHPNIHMFGNHGLSGSFHAHMAPLATKLIDWTAYGGKNVRKVIHDTYYAENSVLDLCCGTGFSTPSNIQYSVGVDISEQMVEHANHIWCDKQHKKTFVVGDAESYREDHMFDIVQIFFAFHEIPYHGRDKILRNAYNNARKSIIIMDISPHYIPSKSMLLGEPYLEDYLSHISHELRHFEEHVIVPDHVHMWKYNI